MTTNYPINSHKNPMHSLNRQLWYKSYIAFCWNKLHISSELLYLTNSHTIGYANPVPAVSKNLPSTPPPPQCNKSYLNISTEFFKCRQRNNVIQNILHEILVSSPRTHPLDFGGGTKAKVQVFRNIVMLHIKLKWMKHTANLWQIFYSQTHP